MKEILNIIIVNDFSYISGGADYVALSSAKALAKRGYNVFLFSAVRDVNKVGNLDGIKLICTEQYDILNDPNRIRSIAQGLWNLKASKQIGKLLDKLSPENTIIHVHSWTKALSSSVVKTVMDRQFKLIITLHDYFSICPNGGLYNYNRNEICMLDPLSLKCICNNCDSRTYFHKVWRILRQIIQKDIGGIPTKVKHFIVVSEFSEDILYPYLPKDSIMYTLSNPIEICLNKRIKVEENTNFLLVGRLSKEKGVDIFAKAANIEGCNTVFVGDGDLKHDVNNYYKNAVITGWLSREGVFEQLSKARALIYPSQLYETQGLSVLEAASIGIPSIISDTCAANEFVINGVNGLVFRRNDEIDLAEKIKILSNTEIAEKLGKGAYKSFWGNEYTINYHVDKLIGIYREVLNS